MRDTKRKTSRRFFLFAVSAFGAMGTLAPQQAHAQTMIPRRPGNGVPVSRPDSQGVTPTWSKLSKADLVQALRDGGLALIFRHGRTDWRTSDQLPMRTFEDRSLQRGLSEEGREQGRRTAAVFAQLGVQFDAVYSSPYFRTKDFAALVTGREPEVTRKLLGFDQVGLDGHRELLSRIPAKGMNNFLSGHQFAVTELGFVRMNELEEGSCLVFRPSGNPQQLELIAHLNHAELIGLPN